MISVNVWDRSLVHPVEKAIINSNLGLSPATEGQTIRLRIPELNEERRKELVKLAHKYAETARVAVRHVRRDAMDVSRNWRRITRSAKTITTASPPICRRRPMPALPRSTTCWPQRKRRSSPFEVASHVRGRYPASALPTAFEVPRHVAIIMDGNGRWAAARGLPRAEGHRRGVEALRRTIRAAGEIGIKIVTIFSFSAENWSRPASEIGELMGLLRRFIRNDLAELHQSNVRVRVIGERAGLEPDIGRLLVEAEELTKNNDGLTLVVAFNYGARQEIARAARRIAAEVKRGRSRRLPTSTWIQLARFLDAPDFPIPI